MAPAGIAGASTTGSAGHERDRVADAARAPSFLMNANDATNAPDVPRVVVTLSIRCTTGSAVGAGLTSRSTMCITVVDAALVDAFVAPWT